MANRATLATLPWLWVANTTPR